MHCYQSNTSLSRAAYDTCYETQSEDEEAGGSKRRKKGWKSKHKNVIDPVFLGELEHLIQDISSCQLELKLSTDYWPDRPSDCVPSIFRRRKIQTPKRRKEIGVKTPKRTKVQKQTTLVLDITESDEQRLPLKKRHHHLQGEGKEGKDAEKKSVGMLQIKSPEKICREFRMGNKGRGEDMAESCLSPSKMLQGDVRSITNASQRIQQEKIVKKPTAADRIVEKLGIQIKRETLEVNNESKSIRNVKVSERNIRRISKELDFTKPETSNSKKSLTQQTTINQVKHESKSKSFTESTFVDNIQDCIEKYTNIPPAETSQSSSKQSQNLSHPKNMFDPAFPTAPPSYVVLGSPEADPVPLSSGRDSSLSQSSASSDSCSVITLDTDLEVMPGKSNVSRGKTSSRQDLHSHLWKQEQQRKQPDPGQQATSSSITAKGAAYRSLISDTMRKRGLDHTSRPQPPSTKPLPTEPIRRVDLVHGFSHKPLDKAGRPLSGQECQIRKVPQAIVAPFRRNPPEQLQIAVVPIHRASIAAHTTAATSLATPTVSSATSLVTATVSPPETLEAATVTLATNLGTATVSPATSLGTVNILTAISLGTVTVPPDTSLGITTVPAVSLAPVITEEPPPCPAPALSSLQEQDKVVPISSVSSPEGKQREEPNIEKPHHILTKLPKTRSKVEQEAKLESTKKEARIKKCKVAVERLDENISRRALLGTAASLEKRVEALHMTEMERTRPRRKEIEVANKQAEEKGSEQPAGAASLEKRVRDLHVTDTLRSFPDNSAPKQDDSVLPEAVEEPQCVTQQLEVLERRRRSIKLAAASDESQSENSSAEPTPTALEKGSTAILDKILDNSEFTKSSPTVPGNESKAETTQELTLKKKIEVVRKRRKKTNKTGFPSATKKRRKVENEDDKIQKVHIFTE